MSNPEVAEGLRQLFIRRSNFVLIGLTGRTGSGCSTAAALLGKEFSELSLPEVNYANVSAEDRKYRILKDFAHSNWHPFFKISFSNVILSFLLDKNEGDLRDFFKTHELLPAAQVDAFVEMWVTAQKAWSPVSSAVRSTSDLETREGFLDVWSGPIASFFDTVRNGIGPNSTKILQLVGDNLRKSGDPFSDSHKPENFYALPDRVSALINLVRDVRLRAGRPALCCSRRATKSI